MCSGCLNKETPVLLKPGGTAILAGIDMGEDYRWQVYYSLKHNAVVGRNLYTAWDLAFEASADGWHIKMNGAKFRMVAYRTTKTNFATVTVSDTTGCTSQIDAPSGNLDSTGIDDWRKGNVYILHRGTDQYGNELGIVKMQVLSVDELQYSIRFSDINDNQGKIMIMSIPKDSAYSFRFFSFDEGGKLVAIEPPKDQWDIVFTRYTHYYNDLDLRYAVVGCLLNSYQTRAEQDTVHKVFPDIDLPAAMGVKLSARINAIGFEWKSYDLNTGKFTVDSRRIYLIADQSGIYYKLRFLDFYKAGVKGVPQWEFQRF
jgi:hypothetical protein